MDMDIDMDRHGRQALWRNRFLVDKLTAHSLMDGLPWRSMHESYRLTWSSAACHDVQGGSDLCTISTMTFRITHDFFNDVQNRAWLRRRRPILHIIAANWSICWLYLFLDPNLIDAHLVHGVSSIGNEASKDGCAASWWWLCSSSRQKKEDKRGDVKNNLWNVEHETSGYSFFSVMA